MKLGDGCETVGKRLGAQIQQGLHEHVDLQGIESGIRHLLVDIFIGGVGQLLQDVDHLLRCTLLSNGDHQLMGDLRAGQ